MSICHAEKVVADPVWAHRQPALFFDFLLIPTGNLDLGVFEGPKLSELNSSFCLVKA